jgi:hypothetical protein
MERLTIYDIKRLTSETSPYFFSRDTMRFTGQTMKSFKVYKQKDGKYLITAPAGSNWPKGCYTKRLFNPLTNELEDVKENV